MAKLNEVPQTTYANLRAIRHINFSGFQFPRSRVGLDNLGNFASAQVCRNANCSMVAFLLTERHDNLPDT